MKKKRFRFSVTMALHELSEVPFLSGMLFVKVKLCDGGSFSAKSSRQGISNHTAVWNEEFSFDCRMTASATDGLLNDCVCRLFIRMVGVNVSLVSGDPCFKRPPLPEVKLTDCLGLPAQTEGVASCETAGATAGSLPSLQTPSHSRQSSQGSGRVQVNHHSRQPSQTSTISLPSRPHSEFHAASTSILDTDDEHSAVTRHRNLSDCLPQSGRRSGMTSTHEAVIDQTVLSLPMADRDEADIPETCSSNSSLQLFVSKNGHATVSGPDTRCPGRYQQVVVTQTH